MSGSRTTEALAKYALDSMELHRACCAEKKAHNRVAIANALAYVIILFPGIEYFHILVTRILSFYAVELNIIPNWAIYLVGLFVVGGCINFFNFSRYATHHGIQRGKYDELINAALVLRDIPTADLKSENFDDLQDLRRRFDLLQQTPTPTALEFARKRIATKR